ncbi:myoD family inhibitor [Tupaia chinensis]|uniref:myoD family inhibitor n=1 Tax=Tupaia chinensis TaxID=246437 RepID=UPI000703F9F2|nr:myoD family inhibitor [Tupaia chinensis]
MSQVSGQRTPRCDTPHGAPSAAPGPAQTLPLLPGLEIVTVSTHPEEAAPEEGSLEEAASPMPQGNGPGVPLAVDSTDLDVLTEAVTCQPQGNPLGCTPLLPNGSGHPSELSGTRRAGNGALGGPKAHRKLQTHPSLASQGSKKSKGSSKSATSQIPLQAQEGKCPPVPGRSPHSWLLRAWSTHHQQKLSLPPDCLRWNPTEKCLPPPPHPRASGSPCTPGRGGRELTAPRALGALRSCGAGLRAPAQAPTLARPPSRRPPGAPSAPAAPCLCCCCCGSGECADCDLPCDLDCGILDACCESADCLEICMECCGLCFSS